MLMSGNEGGGGGGGGLGGGTQPPATTVPWAGVADGQIWTVGDKPWYETAIPDGPAKELFRQKKYANPTVVATSYAELERVNASRDDSKMIRIPDENAKPEDWNQVYEKLGRPKDPSGYKDVKWGENADPQMKEFGQNLAFKLGLSPKAVESVMVSEWNAFVEKANAKAAQTMEVTGQQAVQQLKESWKGDFDANLNKGRQVMQALDRAGFSDADMAVVEQHIGIAPVIKLLATIGKLSGEGKFMESGGGGGAADPANMSPEQAKAEIIRKTGDAAFQKTYMGKTEPGHPEAVKLMEALYLKAGTLMGGASR
jgi:hypothetical protein